MTQNERLFPLPLAISNQDLSNIEIPFEGDLLKRRELANKLTSYIDRLTCGAAIAIDAPWGEGKSWFARHWASLLKRHTYRVGFIDAFQEDYTEDPFLLLASEIRRLSEGDKLSARLTTKAAAVGAALMPLAAKVMVNGIGKLAGTTDLVQDFEESYEKALDKGSEFAQEWTKKRIESYKAEKESVAGFRRTLAEFTAKQERPTVIFIDELDRCRPAFAVSLVERIKHFFEVPNLVFVLVMNRSQLEKAICGVYGAETDAAAYLGKFLHLSLRLPKEKSMPLQPGGGALAFVRATLLRYGCPQESEGFAISLSRMVVLADMSLRDVERACALYILAGLNWNGIMASVIAIKLKHPQVYEELRSDFDQGRQTFAAITKDWLKRSTHFRGSLQEFAKLLSDYGEFVAGSESQDIANSLYAGNKALLGDDYLSSPADLEKFRRALYALDLDIE